MGGYYYPRRRSSSGYGRSQSGYGSHERMLELILRQGDQSAQSRLEGADILSGLLGQLGQQGAAVVDQIGKEKAAKKQAEEMGKRDAAWVGYVKGGTWQNNPQEAYLTALRTWGPEKAKVQFDALMGAQKIGQGNPEDTRKQLGVTIAAAEMVQGPARAAMWPELRTLAKTGLGIDLPEQYDEGLWTSKISPYGRALRGEKPPEPLRGRPGDVFLDPIDPSKKLAEIPEKPEPPKPDSRSLELQAADAKARGDMATYNRLLQVRSDVARADDRPTGVSGPSAETTSLVDAVSQNPALWESLTPTVRGQIAAELNKRGFDFGKPLPEAAVLSIATSKSAVDQLKALKEDIKANEQYVGPLAGVQALYPYSEGRKVQAKLDLARQRVGKALEGGVLRKEDEEKYKKILATLYDDPALAYSKLDGLIAALERDVENYINEQRRAGRRVNTSGTSRGADPLGLRGGGDKKNDPLGLR